MAPPIRLMLGFLFEGVSGLSLGILLSRYGLCVTNPVGVLSSSKRFAKSSGESASSPSLLTSEGESSYSSSGSDELDPVPSGLISRGSPFSERVSSLKKLSILLFLSLLTCFAPK